MGRFMSRDPIPTGCCAVVVVRHGDRFLIVHERQHGQLWFLPAGRVESGETFHEAATGKHSRRPASRCGSSASLMAI